MTCEDTEWMQISTRQIHVMYEKTVNMLFCFFFFFTLALYTEIHNVALGAFFVHIFSRNQIMYLYFCLLLQLVPFTGCFPCISQLISAIILPEMQMWWGTVFGLQLVFQVNTWDSCAFNLSDRYYSCLSKTTAQIVLSLYYLYKSCIFHIVQTNWRDLAMVTCFQLVTG